MTDSELRAAIELSKLDIDSAIQRALWRAYEAGKTDGMLRSNNLVILDQKKHLADIFAAHLTAERTAIKAALPQKRRSKTINGQPTSVVNTSFNEAIDQVTQVIDGREGV